MRAEKKERKMKQIVQVAAGIAALLASGTAWASGTYNNHKTDGTNEYYRRRVDTM